jgi:hypothetical protein
MLERLFYRRDAQLDHLQQSVETSFERVKQDTSSMFQWIAQLWRHAAAQEHRFAQIQQEMVRRFDALPSAERIADIVGKRFDFSGMLDRVRACERIAIETARAAHDVEDLRSDVLDLTKQVGELQAVRQRAPIIDIDAVKAELREDAESIRSELRQDIGALDAALKERQESTRRKLDALTQLQLPIIDRLRVLAADIEKSRHLPRHVPVVERVQAQPASPQPSAASQSQRHVPSVERPIRSRLQEHVLRNVTRNSKDYIKSVILSMLAKRGRMSGLQLRDVIVDEQRLTSKSSFYRLLDELEQEADLTVVVDGKEKVFIVQEVAKKSAEN